MLAVAALAVLPFVQLGLSYYASGATLLLALVLWAWRVPLLAALVEGLPLRALACAPLLLPTLLSDRLGLEPLLRAGREAVFLYVMVSGFEASRALGSPSPALRTPDRAAALLVAGFAALVALQAAALASGAYLGLPREWFVINEGTLPDRLSLLYSRIRPAATFGEPSYLGFVLLSVTFFLLPRLGASRLAGGAVAAVVVLALVVSSASLLVGLALVLGAHALARRRLRAGHLATALALGAVLVAFGDTLAETWGRLLSVGNRDAEASGYARLVAPALALPAYLVDHPLGLPLDELARAIPVYTGRPAAETLHNGLYNLFFFYGLYAVVILAMLLRSVPTLTGRLYLLIAMTLNGGFLAVDKAGVMMLAFLLHAANRPCPAPAAAWPRGVAPGAGGVL